MHDGIARARWLVTRNSYRELADTTLKSFWDWFPPETLGEWRAGDMTQLISAPGLEAEIIFRSLDRPDSIRKLLSLELSGAYVNEAREIPLSVVQMIEGRLGRYPAVRLGGDGRKALLLDTNPPDAGHWWPEVFERERPEGWEQFVQPSGLAKDAENIENLPPRYYQDLLAGKSEEWVNVYVHGKYGYLQDGRPVHPEFLASVHAVDAIEWDGSPVLVGLDFGRTPAAAICQRAPGGGLEQIAELVTENMGASSFAMELRKLLAGRYQGKLAGIWGDPSGDGGGTEDETVFQILRRNGVPAIPAPSQDPLIRRESLDGMLRRITIAGVPAYRVSLRDCPVTVKGLSGFFRYRRMWVGGLEPRFQDAPDKNTWSHVCEALEYLCVGIGEGTSVIQINNGRRASSRNEQRRAVGVI
jgi:hypothetical protein